MGPLSTNSIFDGMLYRPPGELIVRQLRHVSTISNYDFCSETTGPIVTKLDIQSPGPLGNKNCLNGLGHLTKMATMPI